MVRGAINYLYIKYPLYGFKKEPVRIKSLLEVLGHEGVDIVKVPRKGIEKAAGSDWATRFVAYLSYGEDTIHLTKPTLFFNESSPESKLWFGVAHEMGHFLMHRFIDKVNAENIPRENGINGFKGRLELEADIFANHIFMPDIIIDGKFGQIVRECITRKKNQDLQEIFEKIYYYCLEYCNQVLGIEKMDLHPRAILNLKLRASRYISSIREELFILNHDPDNPCELSLKDKKHISDTDCFEKYLNMKKHIKSKP
jgi:Zn-dependent peptidase ImmA (M78 family)